MIRVENLKEFNKDLKYILKRIEEKDIADGVVSKLSFDALRSLQRRTPRKTGRARAGWHNNVDVSPTEWKPNKGQRSYAKKQFKDAEKIQFDSMVNIMNNIEYIIPLENGHSQQAPRGMVAPTMAGLRVQAARLANVAGKKVYR